MKENIMTAYQANALMDEGFHCSQCVFPYVAGRLGFEKDIAFRLSAALGGGIFNGDSCGAVTGAALALGLVYGFEKIDKCGADELLIEKIHEFEDRFRSQTGALLCRQLLNGYDMANREIEAPEGSFDNCGKYCEIACKILDDMIGDKYIF